jgi:dTDP-4-dehydro-6-deoxy-alpha-D-gulose 4-ketoreductase
MFKFSNINFCKVNLLNSHETNAISKGIDIVINAAAIDGNSLFKQKFAAKILDENILITSNILNAVHNNGVKEVVLISSADIYPKSAVSPIQEAIDYKVDFDNIENGYTLSKRYSELMGNLYQKNYGIKVYLPRPINVYGPYDDMNNESRVIPSMLNKVMNNRKVDIWGSGNQERGFIYVEDAAKAILEMVSKGTEKVLNISGDDHVSIIKLAEIIGEVCGKRVKYNFIQNVTVPEINRYLDTTRLNSVLSFRPRSLRQGLQQTLDWYTSV